MEKVHDIHAGRVERIREKFQELQFRHLMVYIIAFFIGRVTLFQGLSPLSVAFFAAAYTKKTQRYIVLLSIIFGMMTARESVQYAKYMVVLVGIITIFSFIEMRRFRLKILGQATIASLVVFLVGSFISLFSYNRGYTILLSALESILVFAMIYIYNKCFTVLLETRKKRVYSPEEMIGIAILFGGIIAGLQNITIFGIYIKEMISFVAILYIAYRRGASFGATVGLLAGFIMAVTGNTNPLFVGVLGVAGLLSGLFKELGKAGSVMGFLIGICLVAFYFDPSLLQYSFFKTLLFSVLLFLVSPKKILGAGDGKIFQEEQGVKYKDYVERMQQITSDQLIRVGDAFGQLAQTFSTISEKKTCLSKKEMNNLFDDIASRVCNDCSQCNNCWQKNFYTTYHNFFDVLSIAEQKGKITAELLPKNFMERCTKVDDIILATNRIFELYRINLSWHNRIVESRELVSEQLNGVADIMKGLSKDIHFAAEFNGDLEDTIEAELQNIGIETKEVFVYENKNKKYEIILQLKPCFSRRICTEKIIPICNEVLHTKMKLEKEACQAMEQTKECTLKLVEEEIFKVRTGLAGASESEISGDQYTITQMSDGQCLLALSDGMGTGSAAQAESAATIGLLEKFMESGFNKNIAVKLINSVLVLKSNEEQFSTLDLTFIDRYSGLCEFIKMGAASAFIKRKNKVEVIRSQSLPVGIINEVDMEVTKKQLNDGDLIIMLTDGVLDINKDTEDKEKWLQKIIEKYEGSQPQDLAEYILEEAKKGGKYEIKDDMTVLVAKLWKS